VRLFDRERVLQRLCVASRHNALAEGTTPGRRYRNKCDRLHNTTSNSGRFDGARYSHGYSGGGGRIGEFVGRGEKGGGGARDDSRRCVSVCSGCEIPEMTGIFSPPFRASIKACRKKTPKSPRTPASGSRVYERRTVTSGAMIGRSSRRCHA